MEIRDSEKSYYRAGTTIGIFLMIITFLALLNKTIFTAYSSIALYLIFALSFVSLVIRRKLPRKAFAIIFLFTALMAFSFLLVNGSVGSMVNYVTTLLFIEMCSSFMFSREQYNIARAVSVLAIFFVFIKSFSYASAWFYYRYNDLNPNTLGMEVLFCLLFYICSSIEIGVKKNVLQVITHVFLILISVVAMINLESRGTLIALIVFLILVIIPKKILSGKRLVVFSLVLIALGVLVPYIFLELYSRNFNLIFLNKSLYTGREVLWSIMLDMLNRTRLGWLLGVGAGADAFSVQLSNVHNDYFVTIFTFGLLGFGLFEINILFKLNDAINNIESHSTARYWLYMFIASVIVLGYTESVTHWAPLYIFAFLPLGIAQTPSINEGEV